ncbi:hypothetical protein M3204_13020 [Mesobacillus subterraneus]|uniref:hypothetical protein n=1 Tax=Mesobacillus subterraneus TaxID=285983 RepID=UPI002040ABC1|nr:hypothetical protein [Mesobacillus subterraneus]MCM3665333.1 hypothetical protein [Mesobacillus subterraneus]MCM3684659.1 hypothetical protein [Mesobacillus subterraneus]
MKKSQLSDKQLEEILGRMPKIKDHRDPRDIYQNIAHRVEKRRMPAWVIPSAALAAVLFLAFILSPGLMGVNHSADKSIDSNSASDAKSSMEMDTATRDDAAKESGDEQENTLMMDATDKEQKAKDFRALDDTNKYSDLTALYNEEIAGDNIQALTYSIPDDNMQVNIPVTVTVSANENENWFDRYTQTMDQLKEEEWGLSEFYPLDGTISYDEESKAILMNLEEDHIYRYGNSSVLLLEAMEENYKEYGADWVKFNTNSKSGADLSNYGETHQLKIAPYQKGSRAYYLFNPTGERKSYIVPVKGKFNSISDAFAQMRNNIESHRLKASIPKDLELEGVESKDNPKLLIVDIKNIRLLNENFLPNLEAILLTAKDFGYDAVKIENAGTEKLGPFNLNEPIQVPVAPNKKNIE